MFCPESLQDSSFSELLLRCRSFRPRSLISPTIADRWKDDSWSGKIDCPLQMTNDFPALMRGWNGEIRMTNDKGMTNVAMMNNAPMAFRHLSI
jgi:hypothetical protein